MPDIFNLPVFPSIAGGLILVAGGAFLPETVCEGNLHVAIAVLVLEYTAALDAVRVFHSVELVGQREMESPLGSEVKPFRQLVFHSESQRQIGGKDAL